MEKLYLYALYAVEGFKSLNQMKIPPSFLFILKQIIQLYGK